jgi:hypothetical protein
MNILSELITKVLETPEVVNQIKKSLVNRDLAIEIDGKKYQIMKKDAGDEIEKLKDELINLKSRLYDIETAAKAFLEVKGNDCPEGERLNDILWNQ